ncbi:LOW QUALITY PROTEIN: T-complex protein 11 homolog [Sycon ciliatum]|uniref:LOW QUALITY PROTEIN: T-complex protein 11 homolog n=1 Tax=Sycon ciliatum TaxID=27933 RepID=UPI0031F6DC5D
MMTAFWDLLREQLKQDPPVFDQVLTLLHDVKEYLLSALPSRRVTTMHMQIDIDLIKQQMQQDILNIKSLAQIVLDVMQRICAPSRDADVQQLVAMLGDDDLDIAAIFKGILDLLSLMRLDLANHELKSIHPVLLQHSARYERERFEQLFPDAPDSGLEHTAAWLTKAQQSCAVAAPGPCPPLGVLRQAFTDLITESVEHGPETWWLDTKQLEMLSLQLKCAVFLQTPSVLFGGLLGREIANSAEFMAQLRDTLFILLDDGNMGDPDEARGHVFDLKLLSSQLKCAVFVQTLSVLIGGLLGREIANSAEFMAQLRDTLFILLDDGNMGDPDEARGHVVFLVGKLPTAPSLWHSYATLFSFCWMMATWEILMKPVDMFRLEMLSSQLKCAVFVQTLSVLIGGLLGREIANSAEFMAQLRDTLFILLDDGNMGDPDEARVHVSVQVISSVDKYREAHGLSPLDNELRQKLELAVTQSHSLENPLHNVLSRRLKACINQAITSQVKHPAELDVPGGFQLVEQRLRSVITSFSRLAVYNQKVFGPIYSTLLQRR